MATYICTHCGYEGIGKADPNRGEGAGGALSRFLGMILLLPVHSLWKMFRPKRGSICPHCGLSRMVKVSSDEGWIARKRFEKELEISNRAAEAKKETQPEPATDDEMPAPRVPRQVDPDVW